jgi:hypothetical protein
MRNPPQEKTWTTMVENSCPLKKEFGKARMKTKQIVREKTAVKIPLRRPKKYPAKSTGR